MALFKTENNNTLEKKMTPIFKQLRVCMFVLLSCLSQQASAIYIDVNFSGSLTSSQQALFTQAEQFWENTLTGYQPSINENILSNIVINAEGTAIDGVGGTLGSAGPTFGWTTGGYTLAAEGDMRFDTADLAALENNGSLESVILHEMAHVLGFGTLWQLNGVYTAGSGQYTGANALSYWQTEFGQSNASYIPIELGGGEGTAGGHWNEVNNGAALTGITDTNNTDMRYELMTGWLNTPTFVSDMTIASFADIGYEVTFSEVPIPAAAYLFLSALTGLALLKRNKSC